MNRKVCCFLFAICLVSQNHAARILMFLPTAAISHQTVSRGLSQELAKRGHDVVVITSDPAFPKGRTPAHITEINVHDAGYEAKQLGFAATVSGKNDDLLQQVIECFHIFSKLFEAEVKTKEVQALISDKNQKFDLLILEACTKPVLIFSHIFKAPVILFSTFGAVDMFTEYTGSAMHPLLFPTRTHQRLFNLTVWEKAYELYKHYMFENALRDLEKKDDEMLKRNFGPDTPSLRELKKRVEMVFIAEHHLWDNNRPVAPNMIYVGGIYPNEHAHNLTVDLPKDIKSYLDSSKNGVIYVSFGTSVLPSLLPQERIQTIVNALSKLPFDVLLKWDKDEIRGLSKNVRLFKWLPQVNILRHPKIKLFITQGGLQSTDDAITTGVPLIGMPMLGDQWYNTEQYVRFKIGLRLDIESLTEENMLNAINTVVNDESYHRNIISLRKVLSDQPQTALDRAVWWAEYVIRNKGAKHLRAPTALISNWEYYELDLIMTATFCLVLFIVSLVFSVHGCLFGFRIFKKVKDD